MIDVNVVNASIARYVKKVTDVKTIKANQSKPAPEGSYATVLISLLSAVGQDGIKYTNEDDPSIDLQESRDGVRRVNASIQFFGTDSLNNAYKMQGASYEASNIDYLNGENLGFTRAGDVLDLSDIELAKYEERAQLDMFFHASDENTNTVSSIQSSEIVGTFETDAGEVLETTIEVNNN